MIRLGILGSTRGTNLSAIVSAINEGVLDANIKVVASNKASAPILARASEAGLNAAYLDPAGLSRDAYDEKISILMHQHQVDLIVLIGYMRILSDTFVHVWRQNVINVHPSLLPAYAGMMDLDVHRAVIQDGAKETGCTVHYVTAELDAGPIVMQKRCAVLSSDSPETLKSRVQSLEGPALVEAIQLIAKKHQ